MAFSLSLYFSSLSVFPSQDYCERDMRHENDEIIISGERHKLCDDGETKGSARGREREGTQQQNMNMKEEILCPLCLLCCVINLQILLPSADVIHSAARGG